VHHSAEYRPFPDEDGRNSRQRDWEIPAMIRALAIPNGARILEVGCGRGNALPVLADRLSPARLVGLDIEPRFLEQAQAHCPERVELMAGDVRELPFEDTSFDVVIDFGTLFHIARADEAVREIARVLVPGGFVAHETKLSQFLSHPVRSRGRSVPWSATEELQRQRGALLWEARVRRQTMPPDEAQRLSQSPAA
jgi:ubiquinone/menaquinone biosynthesis C-methylase UbiE